MVGLVGRLLVLYRYLLASDRRQSPYENCSHCENDIGSRRANYGSCGCKGMTFCLFQLDASIYGTYKGMRPRPLAWKGVVTVFLFKDEINSPVVVKD